MMQQWKRNVWAALLTLATFLSLTGCSSADEEESSVDLSNISSAMVTEGSTEAVATDYAYIMNDDGTIAVSGYTGSDTDLEIPSQIDGYVVTAIADHAFEANWDIKSVVLPNGLITIGESAFSDCGNLTSVVIPDTVGTIRRGAFISCSALCSLTVPSSVTEIMEEAFTGCTALSDLTIENADVEYANWWVDVSECPSALTITCPADSAVAKWATENGIATQTLSE
jgi:hypothetical protein